MTDVVLRFLVHYPTSVDRTWTEHPMRPGERWYVASPRLVRNGLPRSIATRLDGGVVTHHWVRHWRLAKVYPETHPRVRSGAHSFLAVPLAELLAARDAIEDEIVAFHRRWQVLHELSKVR